MSGGVSKECGFQTKVRADTPKAVSGPQNPREQGRGRLQVGCPPDERREAASDMCSSGARGVAFIPVSATGTFVPTSWTLRPSLPVLQGASC